MFKSIINFFTHPTIMTAMVSLSTAGIGYIVARIRNLNDNLNFNRKYSMEMQRSQKRSGLRCEYLNVYNSPYLSIREKYEFTRIIYRDYKNIGGNHYIDELDAKLKAEYKKWKKERGIK